MLKTARRGVLPKITRFSSLLVAGGLLVFALALYRGVTAYQYYNSPFDEVDTSSEYDEGFLPLLSAEDVDDRDAASAPALSGSEAVREHPIVARDLLQARSGASQAAELSGSGSGGALGAGQSPDEEIFTSGARVSTSESRGLQPRVPDRIVIPAIGVDGPVEAVGLREIEYKRQTFHQWTAPNSYAAGWHNTSAPLGIAGNTVLNGHHNSYGEIFRDLNQLQEGDLIYLHSGGEVFPYKVGLNARLNERFRPVEERLENARWILPSPDERLTIITCWPYESNTHRIVIVAIPDRDQSGTIE